MRLLLNGGGSTEQLIPTMTKLNEIIDHNKPMLYVPLAMDEFEHPYDDCYEWFNKQITNIEIPSLDMSRTFKELASKDLNDYSAIFIGGGNTYKLLKGLKESGTFDKIQEYIRNNGIVVGCSAGAVILGKDIDIIASMDPNDVKLTDTKGFDVLSGVSVFPHYINLKSKLTDEENQARIDKFTNSIIEFTLKNGDVYAIPEEDTIYIDGTNVETIQVKYYNSGEKGWNYSGTTGWHTVSNKTTGSTSFYAVLVDTGGTYQQNWNVYDTSATFYLTVDPAKSELGGISNFTIGSAIPISITKYSIFLTV